MKRKILCAAVAATVTRSRLFRVVRLSVCSVCSVVTFAVSVQARAQGPAHAVVLIAIRTYRLIFHPDLVSSWRPDQANE